MPAVDEAMRRSLGLGGGVAAIMARSLQQLHQLRGRDVIGDVSNSATDFRTAVSSWGNCMAVTWCKWPLIAIIIVGSLIVFSILSCIVRRLCCGLACCCECFACLRCCGSCCGCCDRPRDKRSNNDPYIPMGSRDGQGYRMQPPMTAPGMRGPSGPPMASGAIGGGASAPPPFQNTPQYAEFESKPGGGGGEGHEDALPAMPSWDNAASRQVPVGHEMDQLPAPQPSQALMAPSQALMAGANGAGGSVSGNGNGSGSNSGSSRGPSPGDPRGPYNGPMERVPTFGTIGPSPYSDSYSANPYDGNDGASPQPLIQQQQHQQQLLRQQSQSQLQLQPQPQQQLQLQQYPYGGGGQYSPSVSTGIVDQYGQSRRPGDAYSAMALPAPSRSHSPYNMPPPQQQQQQYGPPAYSDEYGRQPPYGPAPRQPNPDYGYPGPDYDRSYQPAPSRDPGYRMPDQRQFSSDRAAGTPPRYGTPAPPSPRTMQWRRQQQQQQMQQQQPPPSRGETLMNNSGFDFNSGYSRPQTPRSPEPGHPPVDLSYRPEPPPLPEGMDPNRRPTIPQLDFGPMASSSTVGGGGGGNSTPVRYADFRHDRDELHGA